MRPHVMAEVRKDAPIFAAIALYSVAAVIVGLFAHINGFLIFAYLPLWTAAMGLFWLVWIGLVEAPMAIRQNPASPMTTLIGRIPPRITPRFVAGAALYLTVAVFYGSFTLIKSALPAFRPFEWDIALANLDRALTFGHQPWEVLQPILGHHWITRGIEVLYTVGWGYLLFAIPLFVATSRRLAHLRGRFLGCLIVAWVALGNGVAAIFMSAGPTFYGAVTGDTARYADLKNYLSFSHGELQSAADLQHYLWVWFEQGHSGMGTGISAFPSIHLATATLFALVLGSISRWAGLAGAVFVAIILMGSVHLGWHYAVDGYASILIALGIWAMAGVIVRRRQALT